MNILSKLAWTIFIAPSVYLFDSFDGRTPTALVWAGIAWLCILAAVISSAVYLFA